MARVHAHMPNLMIELVQDRDFIGLLNELYLKLADDLGNRMRPALIERIGKNVAAKRDFAKPFDRLRGGGFKDWIAIIADNLVEIAHAARKAGLVDHRTGAPRRGRLEFYRASRPEAG